MTTANEELQDRVISHMIYLERYKASEVRRILRILDNDIIPDIEAQIESRLKVLADTTQPSRRLKQLESLKALLTKVSDKMSASLYKEFVKDLTEFAAHEVSWQIEAMQKSLKVPLDFSFPAPALLAGLADKNPFAGFTLTEWFETLSKAQQTNLTREIQKSIVEGEPVAKTMQRVRGTRAMQYTDGVLNTTRRQAEAIVRSTVNHVTNQARQKLFAANKDIISGLKWTSTLDSRTSLICATLDGRVFPVDKGQRPPAHVNCRSTMTPVLKSAKELGLKNIPATTRASIDGQVPGDITYAQWLKKQSFAVQADVLGKTKAKLFSEGNLALEKFSSANLKPLTLQELKLAEKSSFKKANINV